MADQDYIPTKDVLKQDRLVLMRRYYEAHPEELKVVLKEEIDATLEPVRARMDELQGQIVFILHRIDKLHNIKPTPKKRTIGTEL